MARRKKIFNMTNGRCFYCGCELDFDNFHMDHFIPRSSGGKQENNLVPSCPDCNLSKGSLSIEEFRKKISGLITETHTGRIIGKYYQPKITEIKFYFEEDNDGNLQKCIDDILD